MWRARAILMVVGALAAGGCKGTLSGGGAGDTASPGDARGGGGDPFAGGDGFTPGDHASGDGFTPGDDASGDGAAPAMWLTAYIAGWSLYAEPNAAYGHLPTTDIDYSAFSHAVLFALNVASDGSLCCIADWDTFAPDRIRAVVADGHAAGRPVLFSIGGAGNLAFATAITAPNRATLVTNVLDVLDAWGFDGVDLDMEPIGAGDESNYAAFVEALYAQLQTRTTPLLGRPLLTAACGHNPSLFASLAARFDQINIMTYDMSGAWPGWVTWHNSPLYDGGFTFPSTGGSVPSTDGMIQDYLAAGVPAATLGIGIDFYGYVWSGGAGTPTGGVTAPRQSYSVDPAVQDNVPYHQIMDTLFGSGTRVWDATAGAVYLSIDAASDADDRFVSYDDAQTAQAKVDYIRAQGLGGMIIWELGGGYRVSEPAGQRDALLQALRAAAGY